MIESFFEFDMAVTQGDDHSWPLVFSDDNNVPVDISDWDFFYTAKTAISDLDADAVLAIEPVDVAKTASISGGIVNTATFTLPSADTTLVTPGDYFQDIQTVVGGLVSTIARGVLVMQNQVTIRTS